MYVASSAPFRDTNAQMRWTDTNFNIQLIFKADPSHEWSVSSIQHTKMHLIPISAQLPRFIFKIWFWSLKYFNHYHEEQQSRLFRIVQKNDPSCQYYLRKWDMKVALAGCALKQQWAHRSRDSCIHPHAFPLCLIRDGLIKRCTPNSYQCLVTNLHLKKT